MKRNWIIKQSDHKHEPDSRYPEMILSLLALRGIRTSSEIDDFLHPDYAKLNDPFVFRDMRKACDRIWQAIEKKERVAIYADYDADAITALSVVFLGLKKLGLLAEYYIPDRFTEGYGMNREAIQKLASAGARLVITVDCGTNSVEEADLCKELGVDLIITDHHEQTLRTPNAHALINPKVNQESYPGTNLTGVGVAYKLMQGMFSYSEKLDQHDINQGWEKWLLDLVAIGTVADCQDLIGENRILVKYGLSVMEKTRWPGLKALIEIAGISRLDSYAIAFMIAPRINAAGRLKHGELAFRLLTSQNYSDALVLAAELNDLNRQRQLLTEQILSEAKEQVARNLGDKILLVYGDNWPKGIMGLVAGKLCEEYGRPVLVLEKGSDFSTGSARSVEGFDIVKALGSAAEILIKYGGHKQAAGFSVGSSNIEKLRRILLDYADQTLDDQPNRALYIDLELALKDVNLDNYKFIELLSPFGAGNPKPLFLSRKIEIIDSSLVGNQSKHAKIKVSDSGKFFDAVAFNQPYFAEMAKKSRYMDAVFEMILNEWNGKLKLDLKIIDIKFNDQI